VPLTTLSHCHWKHCDGLERKRGCIGDPYTFESTYRVVESEEVEAVRQEVVRLGPVAHESLWMLAPALMAYLRRTGWGAHSRKDGTRI